VAAGFHRQKTGLPGLIQADRLIDDIFVAPLKAVMAAAQLFLNEIRQLVAGDGIGDNGTARGLLRRDGRRLCGIYSVAHYKRMTTYGTDRHPR